MRDLSFRELGMLFLVGCVVQLGSLAALYIVASFLSAR
jgi:hypothetical protein